MEMYRGAADAVPATPPRRFIIVSVLGPPGAGKGTLCSHLAQQYTLDHYSVGDGLRDWMRANRHTPLAATIQDRLDNQGFLTSAELNPFILDAIRKALEKPERNGLLIDGFPRCIEQLQSFDSWPFHEVLPRPESILVLEICVGKSTAKSRYCGRARDQRDSEEKFERRYAEYKTETLPVVQVYRDRGVLVEVDGNGTKAENLAELEQKLKTSALWQRLWSK